MKTQVDTSRLPKIEGARIAILKSKWYPSVTESLSRACHRVLQEVGCAQIDEHLLPGILEMPFAAKHLVRQHRYDVIICLGVVVKGETLHFEMITHEVFRKLSDLTLELDIPIIVEILPVLSIAHAEERGRDDDFNKGIEAAAAAAEIIAWRRANDSAHQAVAGNV